MNVLEAPEMYALIVKMVNFILCEFTSILLQTKAEKLSYTQLQLC